MVHGRFLLFLVLLASAACRTLPPGAECWSLDGRALTPPAPDPSAKAAQLEALEQARLELAVSPEDKNAVIWYARRLGYAGRYREAIKVLSDGLDVHRGDPFLLRHRGHRWITLREFGKAAADLERAADACRTTRDEVEPDGQPTPGRPPHSSLHFNVHYHLGLALFLAGDFELAERAWLDCLAIVANDESRVAVTHWLWCVRVRLRDFAGAEALVANMGPDMDVVENKSYHQLCLLYAGKLQREQIVSLAGSAGSALAFGLAHYRMVQSELRSYSFDPVQTSEPGIKARMDTALLDDGRGDLEALARAPGWSAFGVIAAEVELARWRQ
ncbi:MAG TPA: hypothetical protein VF384_20370 [Planctomycetota bacterium]